MKKRKKKIDDFRCLRCMRLLTDPESIKIGMGPSCLKRTPAVQFQQLEKAGQLRFPGIQ